MPTKLVQSRFVAGPRDELAAVDAYELTENSVTNVPPAGGDGAIDALVDSIRIPFNQVSLTADGMDGEMIPGLRNRVNDFLNAEGLDPANFLDDIVGQAGDLLTNHHRQDHKAIIDYGGVAVEFDPYCLQLFTSMQNMLGGNLLDNLISLLVNSALLQRLIDCGIIPPIGGQLEGIVDLGVREEVALMGIAKVLSNTDLDIDLGEGNPSEGAIHEPLLNIGAAFVAHEVFSDDDSPSDRSSNRNVIRSNPGIRDSARAPVSTDSNAREGQKSLDALEILVEHADSNRITGRFPQIHRRILELYRLPESGDYSLKDEYDRLMGLLERLDEDWHWTYRDGKKVSNLNPFFRASRDSIYLLSTHRESDFVNEVLIGRSHPPRSFDRLFRSQYPLAGR